MICRREKGCRSAAAAIMGAIGVLAFGTGTPAAYGVELISFESEWKFQKGFERPSTPVSAWRQHDFNDADWPVAEAPFYYDNNNDITGNTLLGDMRGNYTSLFLRRSFVVGDPATFENVTLNVTIDDGFIAWINGIEIGRYNVGSGEIAFDAGTPSAIEPETVTIEVGDLLGVLNPGENTIAIQAQNRSLNSSSDFVIDLEISAAIQDSEPPVILQSDPPPGIVHQLREITVMFSEPVLGVVSEDLLIDGAPATSVGGSGATYSFSFLQPRAGLIGVSWDIEHGIVDMGGNRFDEIGEEATWSYDLMDNLSPEIELIEPAPGASLGRIDQISLTFNEPVQGVNAADLLINGDPVLSMTGADAGPFLFEFPQPSEGNVSISWRVDHGIEDFAPVPNSFFGGGWNYDLNPALLSGDVVINEFLASASNDRDLKDQDGDAHDWIELYNRGTSMVNLLGWTLTDDSRRPSQWIFPSRELAPGEYLVVYASGKDRRPEITGELHANFQLSRNGESIALYNGESPRRILSVIEPRYPEQRTSLSYGLDRSERYVYFSAPSPGQPNGSGQAFSGVVAKPEANVSSGFFDIPFRLQLGTETPGANIRYTLDGSEPTQDRGLDYQGGIDVAGNPRKAVINVRAIAIRDGYLPSRVATYTYVFPQYVIRQPSDPDGFPLQWITRSGTEVRADYGMDPRVTLDERYRDSLVAGLTALPTLSIVMETDDLFDRQQGLYANPQGTGVPWERPAAAVFLFPDENQSYQIDAGFRLQGGSSRRPNKSRKHSLRLLFKGDYGAKKMEYSIFPDSPVNRFDTLVLDNRLNYAWHYNGGSSPEEQRRRAQYVRDQFVSDLQLAMGWPAAHGRKFHLYLNGLYWGTTGLHERPDASFSAEHLGGEKEDYDSIKNTTGFHVLDGDTEAWDAMIRLANSSLRNAAQYEQIQQYVDIVNLIDYFIVNCWVGNTDWPHHNWYVGRKREDGAQFKFFIWDAEHSLKSVSANRTTVGNSNTPAQVYDRLRRYNEEFRLLFADRLQRHFFNGGLFYVDPNHPEWDPEHPERNIPASHYMARINEIEPALALESARWGDNARSAEPYTKDAEWQAELDWMLEQYLPRRSAIVLNQFRSIGLYPDGVVAPGLNQHGGRVPLGFELSLSVPSGTVYYTLDGSDPRQYGTGNVANHARVYTQPLALTGSVRFKARTLERGEWSALTEAQFDVATPGPLLRITEIMYHPVLGDPYEYIEIQNVGSVPVDVGQFEISGVGYHFPAGTTIGGGEFVVVASSLSPSSFEAVYPTVTVSGYFEGRLADGGERVAILDAAGRTLLSVDYDDELGWPLPPDGEFGSLEILDHNGDPDDPANWHTSADAFGSPGEINSVPVLPTVRITELMADNVSAVDRGGLFPDWIELRNTSQTPVDLSGWRLSDDGDPVEFVFPAGTVIAGDGFLLIWCDSEFDADGLHAGFALGRRGESIQLFDANGTRVDAVTYGLQAPDFSLGRIEDRWMLCRPTPQGANEVAELATLDQLSINEWVANSRPGEDDWIEFYNRDPELPLSLKGIVVTSDRSSHEILSHSFVGPNGFAVFFADENPGPDHLDFRLLASGDSISVVDGLGRAVESVRFEAQGEGYSAGRLPDGGTEGFVFFPTSTSPEASNHARDYEGPVLSEIMARNVRAVLDPWGGYSDWFELWNPTDVPVSLDGFSLGKSEASVGQFVFPSGITLASGDYLVVWCDPTRPASVSAEGAVNCGFSLLGSGDEIVLFDDVGRVGIGIKFGFQVIDRSLGFGEGVWRLVETPSPDGINSELAQLGPASSLRVNEWMADPVEGDDWFEIYNPDTLPVSLAGLFLSDDPSQFGKDKYQIKGPSYIGPQNWIQWISDGETEKGLNHVSFNLARSGEILRLYDAGFSIIDEANFGAQASGGSEGRLPDGSDLITRFTLLPTPATGNIADADALPVIVMQPENLSVTVGESAVFVVEASGPPPLGIQWFHSGIEIPDATLPTLILKNVRPGMGGEYQAIVSNPAGNVSSAIVILEVSGPMGARIDLIQWSIRGKLVITASVPPGVELALEASEDLERWEVLAEETSATSSVEFEVDDAGQLPMRFFRVRAL